MDTVVLVSCGKTKNDIRCTAENMYTSNRFKLVKEYSMNISDKWFIVSAKYGLLEPDREIEPYDMWLNDFSSIENKIWCDNVRKTLSRFSSKTKFVILLNGQYAELIMQLLSETGHKYIWPLKNVKIDELESYLVKKLNKVAIS